MPEEQVPQHLEDFSAFAERMVPDRDRLIYLRARIKQVRLVCGCVITPEFDEANTIQDFLFQFNQASNGLLFLADMVFDYDGEMLGELSAEGSR